jgi:hypothetical protein
MPDHQHILMVRGLPSSGSRSLPYLNMRQTLVPNALNVPE